MSKNKLSLLAQYDDFCRQTCSLLNGNQIDVAFLIAKTEENRIKWLQAETELREANQKVNALIAKNNELETKIKNLRKSYGLEAHKTRNQQKENERFRAILDLVRKTVNDDYKSSKESLHTVTSEGFDFMRSVLNDPDQFLKNKTRKSDVMRPSQSFEHLDEEELEFDKTDDSIDQSCGEQPSTRRNTCFSTQNDETVLHQTEVKKFRTGSPNVSISDHIEKDLRTDTEETDPPLSEVSVNPSICVTPNAVYSSVSLQRNHSRKAVQTDLKRLDSRPHTLITKKFYKTTICNVCDRRIGFCSNAVACEDCKSIAHSQCQQNMKLPCIQYFTPKRTERHLIGDYAAQNVRPFVPPILIYLCKEIENRGLKEEGIYRKCGSDREIRELKNKILKSKSGCPNLDYDIHTLCGVVKSFLKNLDEPLVSFLLWNDFIKTTENFASTSVTENERSFNRLLNRLPDANRDVIAYIILHLKKVAEYSEFNKMEEYSLARIFAPTIVGWSTSSQSGVTQIEDNSKQITCMHAMISMPKSFWENILEQPKSYSPFGTIKSMVQLNNQSFQQSPALSGNSVYATPAGISRNVHVRFNSTRKMDLSRF